MGDVVLGAAVPNADGSPAFPPTYRHVAAYRDTLAQLANLRADLLLTAHYPTMRGAEADAFLHESLAFTYTIERHVLDTLAHHRSKPPDLAPLLASINSHQWHG